MSSTRRPMSRSGPLPLALSLTGAAMLLLLAPLAAARARGPHRVGAEIRGRVTQITASSAYVNFGARHGVKRGDPVRVRLPDRSWGRFAVEVVADRSARLAVPATRQLPAVGAPARARYRRVARPVEAARTAARPQTVTPPDQLARAWRGVERAPPRRVGYKRAPVEHRPVPRRRVRGYLRLDYAGALNLGSEEPRHYSQVSLASALEVPRLLVGWLDYAHRLRLSMHFARDLDARPFQQSRPLLRVDRLRLGMTLGPVRALLGRTVGAPLSAATLVDGTAVRVQAARWLYLGAFGGLLPRSTDLRPAADGAHFGAYASVRWAAERGRARGWQLAADLGFAGTTWDGQIDRRALAARATLDGPSLSLHADAVVDLYDADHPSGLSSPALTQLGVGLDGQPARWLRLGGRYDRYRFVPSREHLASYPQEFVVGDTVSSARGHADLRLGAAVTLGGQGGYDRQGSESWSAWGEMALRTRALLGEEDLRLSALYHHGSTLGGVGGRLALLQPVARWLSLSGSYALFHDRYTELDESLWRHAIAAGGELRLGWHWFVGAEAQTLLSSEEKLLQLFGTLRYDL